MECPLCQTENPDTSRFCRSCTTPLPFQKEPSESDTKTMETYTKEIEVGSIFAGRYKILEKLGKGGMGVVYKALDVEIQEYVALKLLNPEIASNKKMIDRFRNEMKYARKITHKNVCRMYHLSKEEETFYFTMEYLTGEDLKSFIERSGRLPEAKAIAITKQICRGLTEAHSLGIVHRDLKPRNIMINKEGNAQIMDFGIARSIEAKGMTETGTTIGTPDYMSPEQVEGREVDQRSDIYSLGIIFYEIVTGRTPFKGNTPYSIALKQKTEVPQDPMKFNPQLSIYLSRLILKCLEKDKNKRYQSAKELFSELNNIEKEIPPIKKVRSERKKEEKTSKKHFRPLVTFGMLLFMAVIIIGGYFYLNRIQQTKKNMMTEEEMPGILEQKNQKTEVLPPQFGTIEITSIPDGVEVYLSNKLEGVTPFKHELLPGAYKISIRKDPEYKEITDVLNIRVGETSLRNYNLTPAYLLKIDTRPEGADIIIDGNYRGKTPLQIELVRSICQMTIEKGNEWIKINESLILKPGLNNVQRSLNKIMFTLSIKTNPPGAQVFIDGKSVGISPAKKMNLLGELKIRIEKDGYEDIEDLIIVDSNFEKIYALTKTEPKKGKITIKVRPYADILVDGKLLGEVPPVRTLEIVEGNHKFEFISIRMNKKFIVEVEIKAGDNKELIMNMETGQSEVVDIK